MGDRIDLLIRQAADGNPGLQVFLTGPGQQNAFVLPEPSQLIELQKVWRQRFLKHHDPAFAWAEGAAVVRSYSEQLRLGLQKWLESSAWQPLIGLLADFPAVPLTVKPDARSQPKSYAALCMILSQGNSSTFFIHRLTIRSSRLPPPWWAIGK